MARFVALFLVVLSAGCLARVAPSDQPEACAPYAYEVGARVPLYPCDDDPNHPHAGPQYRPVVERTQAGDRMTCVCEQ